MVQLEGTYEFVSEENYLEYLKSFGLDDGKAQKQAAVKSSVVIKAVSADSITIAYDGQELTAPIGKEVERTLSIGHKVKGVVTVNGDTITFKNKYTEDGSLTEEKVWKITDSGLTSTSTNSKGGKGVRHYKRV